MIMEKSYYTNERREVLDLINERPQTVLELGCGGGTFGHLLKTKYNCTVTGIELFSTAAEKAREVLDQVYNESLDEFDFCKLGKYDLIVANDILEHLLDPWRVVEQLREHLTDNGMFIASIPNIQNHKILTSLIKGRWDYVDEGILDRTHLRFFTRETAAELFAVNGYSINRIVPLNVDEVSKTNILKKVLKFLRPDWYALQFAIIAKKV